MEKNKDVFMDDPHALGLYEQLPPGEYHYPASPTKERIMEMVNHLFDYMEAHPDSFISRFYATYPFGSPPFENPFETK